MTVPIYAAYDPNCLSNVCSISVFLKLGIEWNHLEHLDCLLNLMQWHNSLFYSEMSFLYT